MEMAPESVTTVGFEVPPLPVPHNTVKPDPEQGMGAYEFKAVSPHQKAILIARVTEVQPFLGTMGLNPIQAEQ
jgi:hypothetical protein